MFSRINSTDGTSLFDKQWHASNFLGVYDDWLNYTGSYLLERTLDCSTEVALIGFTDTTGKLTLLKATIADDNNPLLPAASPVFIMLEEASTYPLEFKLLKGLYLVNSTLITAILSH